MEPSTPKFLKQDEVSARLRLSPQEAQDLLLREGVPVLEVSEGIWRVRRDKLLALESDAERRALGKNNRHPVADELTIEPLGRIANRVLPLLLEAPGFLVTGREIRESNISGSSDDECAARIAYKAIVRDFPSVRPFLRFRKASPPAVWLSNTPRKKHPESTQKTPNGHRRGSKKTP